MMQMMKMKNQKQQETEEQQFKNQNHLTKLESKHQLSVEFVRYANNKGMITKDEYNTIYKTSVTRYVRSSAVCGLIT